MWPLCSSNMRAPFSLFPSHSTCFCWLKGESNVSFNIFGVWVSWFSEKNIVMIGFLQEYGITVLGFTFTLELSNHVFLIAILRQPPHSPLSIYSANQGLVLYLSYTLSRTPSRRYSANVTYKLWAIFGETDHNSEDARNSHLKDGEESQGKLPSIGKREQTPLGVPEDRSGWMVECLLSAKHVSYNLSTSPQFCRYWN